jgi:diguanylate cyclase (GGDEF)-like protein
MDLISHDHFCEQLGKEFDRIVFNKERLTIMVIEFINTKYISDIDSCDFEIDLRLIQIERLVRRKIKTTDFFGRTNVTEFAIALKNTNLNEGIALAQGLKEAISEIEMYSLENNGVDVSMKIGLAEYIPQDVDYENQINYHFV